MGDFVPTRASEVKGNSTNNYVSVIYNTRKKGKKSTDNLEHKEKLQKDSKIKQTPAELKMQQEKEMKKARYDVIKFGMAGFEKVKARKAKVELAISLGAVPPKNKRRNYKLLKADKKKEKEKIKTEQPISGFGNSLHKSKPKVHKKDSGILGIYGKVSKTPSKQKK